MQRKLRPWVMALGALLLAACGGDGTNTGVYSTSTTPGTATWTPPFRIASVNAATLAQQLGISPAGLALLDLAGLPVCGVDVYYLKFATTGGAGEATQSSGALMVPNGLDPSCHGPRPIVEYAHGDWTYQPSNIADVTDPTNTEGLLIAAMFAAHGYIVVAPNYAGYDISTLGYHPYVNAAQQSGEMMDALTAARAALPHTFTPSTSDNGQLFLTGYSQGGYVAMATQRAMQAAGMTVTAAAPLSGPYALEAFADAAMYGNVNLGSTVFTPLIANSYQNSYTNVYDSANPIFSDSYPTAAVLLPSNLSLDTIFATGLLPETALLDITPPGVAVPGVAPVYTALWTCALASVPPQVPCNPPTPEDAIFRLGFGNPYLINNAYRVSYAKDAASNPDGAVPLQLPGVGIAQAKPLLGLRQDLWLNDLRNDVAGDGKGWAPTKPSLLCGGDQDPTVFFPVNTGTMATFWSVLVQAGLVTVLDVSGTPSGPFKDIQIAFQAYELKQLQGGATAQMLVQSYHTDVAPFCALAARSFFEQF